MRKWTVKILALAAAIFLIGCGGGEARENKASAALSSSETITETDFVSEATLAETEAAVETHGQWEQNKILIAYFTWAENAADTSGVDAFTSASMQMPGNVAQMAAWIQQGTGGDLFSIRVEEPYSADYEECLDRAAAEKAENARPSLIESVAEMGDYDTVFLGFPNWWYGAPMPVFSFLEGNDLGGKKVVLFCSHGTGGLASGVKDISAMLPDSDIEANVLGVYRDDIPECQETIYNWLKEIGYQRD